MPWAHTISTTASLSSLWTTVPISGILSDSRRICRELNKRQELLSAFWCQRAERESYCLFCSKRQAPSPRLSWGFPVCDEMNWIKPIAKQKLLPTFSTHLCLLFVYSRSLRSFLTTLPYFVPRATISSRFVIPTTIYCQLYPKYDLPTFIPS